MTAIHFEGARTEQTALPETGAARAYGSVETTVTDLGSTVSESLPFWILTVAGFGTTASGKSKVLILSTAAPVNVSALADLPSFRSLPRQ